MRVTKAVRTRAGAVARALATAVLTGCGGGTVALPNLSPSRLGDTTGFAVRGEYLVRSIAVCGHCHAADPADPDGPLSGGLAFRNWRLGTIRAANLTPDSATGIGAWTVEEIVRALRTGEDRAGHVLAPVMPYEWFNGMSDRDALAVALYLKSLAPVRREVRSDPNLVYRLARVFILKPADDRRVQTPPRAASVNYGRYLANHVALCADCHTPRGGIQNSPDRDKLFSGDNDPDGFPARPANLTPDSATGIGTWSETAFVRTLRTGINPAGDTLHSFMPWRELRRMEDDDLRAIYRYLRTIKPIRNEIERSGSTSR